MNAYFNSQNETFKKPFGAVVKDTEVMFSIGVDNPEEVNECLLVITDEKKQYKQVKMDLISEPKGKPQFIKHVRFTEIGLYLYYIKITTKDSVFFYGDNERRHGGEGKLYMYNPNGYQMIVHLDEKVPSWFKEGIIYQIFPDRFRRSANWTECQKNAALKDDFKGTPRIIMESWNDLPFYPKDGRGAVTRWPFFGGNLRGIKDKLFYLKSLGVNVIYLNPIFSALSNHKYDTWDYMKIDESFGSAQDFVELCKEAEYMGIKIILDGVFNHVGAESPYFDRYNNFENPGACRGPKSPYFKWFTFTEFPDKYKAWWGIGDLPEVNEVPEFMDYILEVVKHWIKLGAAGFRLDVADELTDGFIEKIREATKSVKKDAVIIGEVWDDASNKESYGVKRKYFLGKELDSTMNYVFRDEAISYIMGSKTSAEFCAKIFDIYEEYPKENFYSAMNLIGSHDKARILTILGEAPSNLSERSKEYYKLPEDKREISKKRFKILTALQFAVPGVPSIYYGDEAGLEGYEDPYNRGTFPWGNEDEELIKHLRKLSDIRRNYEVMTTGLFVSESLDGNILCIRRFNNEKALAVITVINNSKTMSKVARIHVGDDKLMAICLLSSEEILIKDEYIKLALKPLSYEIIYLSSYMSEEKTEVEIDDYIKYKDAFKELSIKNGTNKWQTWPKEDRDLKKVMKREFEHTEYVVFKKLEFFVPIYGFETWAYREAFILDDLGYPINGDKYPAYNCKYCHDLFAKRIAYVVKHKGYVTLGEIDKYISYEITAPEGEILEIPGPGRGIFERLINMPIYVENPDLNNVKVSNLIKTTSLKVL